MRRYVHRVYWLSRPPRLRQTLALLLLIGAVVWELRPIPTELRPFLRRDVVAGEVVAEADLEWREVPAGVLPEVPEPTGRFAVSLDAGNALPVGATTTEPELPPGWWGIEVAVPEGVAPGTEVRLVVGVRATPEVIPGRVIRLLGGDALDGNLALVAIPESQVVNAAVAAADGSLQTLVGSP